MLPPARLGTIALLAAQLLVGCATSSSGGVPPVRSPALSERPLSFEVDGRWIGNGVAYGPHREGQRPGGASPTVEQLREDVQLLRQRWRLWRMYGAGETTEAVLALVEREAPEVRLIVGAWIAPETTPEARRANRAEIEGAIRLAHRYPKNVLAISVGNETQVSWSDHRVPTELLVAYLREVRAAVTVPVTTADDFGFWVTPESEAVAREVDLLMVHVYAMWNGQPLERAVTFTREKYAEVARRHPGRTLVLGELGWATKVHTEGEQARLIRGVAGEAEQKRFLAELLAWTTAARVPNLYFEAFDEPWKGGPHPDEVEKHWGLYHSDRTPK